MTQTGRYFAAIRVEAATHTPIVKVWSERHRLDAAIASVERTIGIPADARGAFTVGAVDQAVWTRPVISEYSSRGPTVDGRVKPDIVAPSGVSTITYGRLEFYGTSAAAPHVAGAAALVKSAKPAYSAQQIVDALTRAAVDVGASGKDNVYGYGKLAVPLLDPVGVPTISIISPATVRYNDVVTIAGTGFGVTRGTSRVVFFGGSTPSAGQYVSWGDTRIRLRVPTGARSGVVKVVTGNGESAGRQLHVSSPWLASLTPLSTRAGEAVVVTGEGFGAARGSSTIKLNSVYFGGITRWSDRAIHATVPANASSGDVTVTTGNGLSNSLRLTVTSPYVVSMSPVRGKVGDRITLTGGNFGTGRGTAGVVLFGAQRPPASDYVSWADRTIVVKIPARATSCEVKVVTAQGESGQRHLDVESELLPIPSAGPFGYSPPTVSANPKGVTFVFQRGTTALVLGQEVALLADREVRVYVNGRARWSFPANANWATYYMEVVLADMVPGQNTIEYRNETNQNRSSGFDTWMLRNIALWKPYQAKLAGVLVAAPVAGAASSPVQTALGRPYPVPFNATVTIPFAVAEPADAQITVVDVLGRQVTTLLRGPVSPGAYTGTWDGVDQDGRQAASGPYLVIMSAAETRDVARVVLLR